MSLYVILIIWGNPLRCLSLLSTISITSDFIPLVSTFGRTQENLALDSYEDS